MADDILRKILGEVMEVKGAIFVIAIMQGVMLGLLIALMTR